MQEPVRELQLSCRFLFLLAMSKHLTVQFSRLLRGSAISASARLPLEGGPSKNELYSRAPNTPKKLLYRVHPTISYGCYFRSTMVDKDAT